MAVNSPKARHTQGGAKTPLASTLTLLGKRLLRAALTILLVSAATYGLEHAGLLHGFEFMARDFFLAVQAPKPLQHVRIVGIDEQDYQNLFGGHLPLDAGPVQQLVQAIAKAKPRAIGIDIDTGAWKPGEAWSEEKLLPVKPQPKLIWARDADLAPDNAIRPLSVQGGRKPSYAGDTGLAVVPKDPDGVFRRCFRRLNTGKDLLPSFPWAVFSAVDPAGAARRLRQGNELTLNFAGDRYELKSIPAREVLQWASGRGYADANYFTDKIVLVGNEFHTARDEHVTPVGRLSGVKLMAQAIESELDGGGIRAFDEIKMVALDVVLGVALVVLHQFVSLGRAFLLSVLGGVFVAPFCSYLAFSSLTMWVNFIPVILAVLIHQLYDHAREYRRLYQEAQEREPDKREAAATADSAR